MISRRQRDISYVLDETVDGGGGEPRTPESNLQAHNTETYLRMRWILVDVSLLAKWELYKPLPEEQLANHAVEVLPENVGRMSQ